jgi:hypothetical protein
MKLIGITGKARSGKDTIAEHLWAEHAFTRIAFADPLKLAAQHIFGLTEAQTWDDDMKEVVIPYWGMSPRQIFQYLGTEAVKGTFGPDTWIKRWAISYNLLKDTDHIVVTDVRTNLEAQAILNLGGVIIEVVRDGVGLEGETAKHSSEFGLTLGADFIILNNGTLAELYEQVDAIVGGLA